MAEFWYDGNGGSDANPGTEALPFLTLGSATVDTATGVGTPTNLIVHLKRGTTVQLASNLSCYGTFLADAYGDGEELATLDKQTLGNFSCVVGYSSTAGQVQRWESIKALDPVGTTLTAGFSNAATSAGALEVVNCESVGFQNSVSITAGTAHKVSGCTFTDYRNNGIYVDTTAAGVVAPSDMQITDNTLDGRISTGGVCSNDGITLHGAASGPGRRNIISGNTVVSGTESCIEVATNYNGTIISRNVCYARQDGTSTSNTDIGVQGDSTVVRGNVIFKRYRRGIDVLAGSDDVVIEANSIIEVIGNGEPLVRINAVARPTVRSNLFVIATGATSSKFTGMNSITVPFNLQNNLFVNYSAGAMWFIGAQTAADVDTWAIDGNTYVQMPGSVANAWRDTSTTVNWAGWKARAGAPDANSMDPLTSLPVTVPAIGEIGAGWTPDWRCELGPANVLIGQGVHIGYVRDANRVQRPNPPSPGPYDLPTQRRVLDSDPAGW